MNKQNRIKFALASSLELRKIERQAVTESTNTLRRLRNALLRNSGNVASIRSEISKLLPLLTNTLLSAYLLGQRRTSLVAERDGVQLQLSTIRQGLDYLKRIMELTKIGQLDALQDKIGSHAIRILNGVSDDVELKLREKVNDVIERNLTTRDAKVELSKAFKSAGIDEDANAIEAVFRTQSSMAYNSGVVSINEENEYLRDIIWGYEFSAIDDQRITPVCHSCNGVRLPTSNPFWNKYSPPLHWNCRSMLIPVYGESNEIQPPSSVPQPQQGFGFNPINMFGE